MPTETVYGLAARIDSEEGLRRIFSVKQRPFFDPLIVHVASIEDAKALVSEWNPRAEVLAQSFWPGPLTLVLPKNEKVSSLITSGLMTVGLRCPAHPLAQELIRKAGVPLAAPSANRFGRTSPTRADHVRQEFQNQVFVLEGGESEVGIESTIVMIEEATLKLLRPGHLSIEKISSALREAGLSFTWAQASGKTEAPGQMKHHYMPAKPLIVSKQALAEATLLNEIKARLSELPTEVDGVRLEKPSVIQKVIRLTLPEDPVLAARALYQSLREAASGAGDVIVLDWPESRRKGDWVAVWDRLRKAASLDL